MNKLAGIFDVEKWIAKDSFEFEHAKPARTQPVSRGSQIATAFLLLITFLILGLNQVVVTDDPEQYDIPAYLMEATRIAEFGGVFAWPGMVLSGQYYQALQNPLYLLAITPFSEFDTDFMVSAKLVSLFFGCLTILVAYFWIQKLYSQLVAAIATTGFVMTHLFVQWSTLVACESLLLLFSISGVIAVMQGFRQRSYWVLAGFLFGLAYLTKITALFLLPGFVIAVLLTLRTEAFRTREFYLFFVAFLLASSPLLINNTIVYGNPIYHVSIDATFDDGTSIEYYEISMQKGSMIPTYGESVMDDAKGSIAPSEGKLLELVGVVVRRIPGEFVMFLENFSIWPIRWAPMPVRWAFGAGVVAFFLVGLRREKNIGSQIYVGSTVLVFLLALTLHRPIERYLLPVMFFVWVFAAMGVIYLAEKYAPLLRLDRQRIRTILIGFTGLACISTTLFFASTKPIGEVANSVYLPPHRIELLEWMRQNIGETDKYVEGPNYRWLIRDGIYLFPKGDIRESKERFDAFVRRNEVKFVIAEMESMHRYRYRGGLIDRQLKFEGVLEFDEKAGIRELELPEGWVKVAQDEQGIVEYIVYEIHPAQTS